MLQAQLQNVNDHQSLRESGPVNDWRLGEWTQHRPQMKAGPAERQQLKINMTVKCNCNYWLYFVIFCIFIAIGGHIFQQQNIMFFIFKKKNLYLSYRREMQ